MGFENNTHGELIILPGGGHAFIDGVPDECDHEWNGPSVFYTQSGKRITIATFLKWASYTEPMRNKLIHEHQDRVCDPITTGGVTCSKCKKEFTPSMF